MTSYINGSAENGQLKFDEAYNEDDLILEDDESNSAKLFERSRIRALAGMLFINILLIIRKVIFGLNL